jgi:outer membrane protein OmpA-like peptidoglycan-associated protein
MDYRANFLKKPCPVTAIKIYSLIGFCFMGLCLFGQNIEDASTRQLRKYRKGALREKDHYTLIAVVEELQRRNPKPIKYTYERAKAQLALRHYSAAHTLLKTIVKKHALAYPDVYFMLFETYTALGLPDSALWCANKVRDAKRDPKPSYPLRKWVKVAQASVDMQKNADTLLPHLRVGRLVGDINQPNIEFSPQMLTENKILFGSLPHDSSIIYSADSLQRQFFLAEKVGDTWKKSIWEPALEIPRNTTPSSVYAQTDTPFYIASFCRYNWKYEVKCKLYHKARGGTWTPLPKAVNRRKYTQTHPWVTPTKNDKHILYFVSDRPGGKGGTDIWQVRFKASTFEFETPRNAGNKINTPGNEISPRYNSEMKKLWFSSDGHTGYGGLDVYYAIGERSRWSVARNAGKPINSNHDDVFFAPFDLRRGVFTSNRTGVSAQFSPHCCDDIFYCEFEENTTGDILISTIDKLTGIPLDHVMIKIFVTEPTEGEEVFLGTFPADSLGRFRREFEDGFKYKLIVGRSGYLNHEYIVDLLTRRPPPDTITDLVALEPWTPAEKIIPNIYFDFNSDLLSEASKHTLDTTAVRWMLQNPELTVEIGAHTDNKGSEAFNLDLSRRRAESVVKYLILKGIKRQRLSAKGYGESRPIAPNNHNDGSDNAEGRALNRRTTFRITGENPPAPEIEEP